MSSTFTPPFTRRHLSSASRAATSGTGNVTGGVGFYGPASLPTIGFSAAMSQASRGTPRHQQQQAIAANDQQLEAEARRNTALHRMRAHRSLDAADLSEYDPLLQHHHPGDSTNAPPPADPPAAGDSGGGATLFTPFGGGFSTQSQGNLLHLTAAPVGASGTVRGPYSNVLTAGQYGQGSSANYGAHNVFSNPTLLSSSVALTHPAMGSGAMATGGSPYSYQSYLQQQHSNPMNAPSYYYSNASSSDPYSMPVPILQREFEILRREYENTVQKLNSNLNSIKTFWSPELKKERSMRKEEASRSALIHEQLRMVTQEAQRQSQVIRQLQTELQCQYELSRTIRDTELQSVSKEQYESVRLERERLQRELSLSKETLRDVEVQLESQRQTLASKDESIKKLLDMLQTKGTMTYSAAQDRLELEQSRARQIEMENRCRRYEASLQQKDRDMRSLREECLAASEKLRQTQSQFGDQYQTSARFGYGNNPTSSTSLTSEVELTALRALLETKQNRIGQLEQRLNAYETEMTHLRELKGLTNNPHPHYSVDKSIMDREYQELKSRIGKLELELAQKQTELETTKTRLAAAEEQANDLRKRVELGKESLVAKEQQVVLLQADVTTLRGKLESRNETIEQKTRHLQQAQLEKNRQQHETADLNEQLKIRDGKIASLQRKIDSLEDAIKERDSQIESLKQRISTPPSTSAQQHKFQEQVDELSNERERLLKEMREQRERIEAERLEELDVHRREVRDLRMAIESLQKDITDRQVLIESQHEKISDLTREVTALRSDIQTQAARQADGDFYVNEFERLNRDLDETRAEVERLLRTVSALEKEKEELRNQIRTLERQMEDSQPCYSTTLERKIVPSAAMAEASQGESKLNWDQQAVLRHKEQRVDELEEALKESVSITAERELAIAQHKQTTMQLEAKLNQYKEQLARLQHQYDELNNKLAALQQDKQDKESLIRSLKHERKKHLEEVLQLKEESLLAAISEKDAHIALLETSQSKNPEEIDRLRRHKDKLIKKLKEENVRRVKLFNDMKESSATNVIAIASTSSPARPATMETDQTMESSLANDLKFSPVDQIVQSIRFVELQKKKLRVFIDQLLACMLDIDPELLTGLPRTQQSSGVDIKLLKKLTHEQLLLELQQRDTDSLQLQRYATQLMQRLAVVQPTLVRRAMKLLDSFNGHPSTSEAFFYERLSRHYQKRQLAQRPASTLPIFGHQQQQKSHRRSQLVQLAASTISLQALR